LGITETALPVGDKHTVLIATYFIAAGFYFVLLEATDRWWKEK